MDSIVSCFRAGSAEEMVGIGAKIAEILTERKVAVLFLEGDLGAGKTTLTSGLAKALGIKDEITSPSFVINKKYYVNGELKLSHYDFYRLEGDAGIMEEETREDALNGAIVVVEWGGGIGEILPEEYFRAKVTTDERGEREVRLEEVMR